MVVAVTAEKKVAIVDRLSRLDEPCFCANRIVGTPAGTRQGSGEMGRGVLMVLPTSMNMRREDVIPLIWSPISCDSS